MAREDHAGDFQHDTAAGEDLCQRRDRAADLPQRRAGVRGQLRGQKRKISGPAGAHAPAGRLTPFVSERRPTVASTRFVVVSSIAVIGVAAALGGGCADQNKNSAYPPPNTPPAQSSPYQSSSYQSSATG